MYNILTTLQTRLKTQLGNRIKHFHLDDPNLINLSSLPCIAITPVTTSIDIADTSRDKYTHDVDIFVIINALTELKRSPNEMVGMQFLTKIAEEKDSNGTPLPNTVIYALRNDLELGDNLSVENVGSINYGIRVRDNQMVTLEASISVSVTRILNR